MLTNNIDRSLLLSLLIAPVVSLPIPPLDPRAKGAHFESTELHFLPYAFSRPTLGCSGLKKVLPGNQGTPPKDENLLAALILADSANERAFDLPIFLNIEGVENGIPEEEDDGSIEAIDLDIELEPRQDLRKRGVTPPIAGRPIARQPVRSQSAGRPPSRSQEQHDVQRSASTGGLLAGGKKLHLLNTPMTTQKKQEIIDDEVEEVCGGFDDRYGKWFTASGRAVSLEDFKNCVKDVKRRITAIIESATPADTIAYGLNVGKTKVADLAVTADSVAKAANKFLGSGAGEQRVLL